MSHRSGVLSPKLASIRRAMDSDLHASSPNSQPGGVLTEKMIAKAFDQVSVLRKQKHDTLYFLNTEFINMMPKANAIITGIDFAGKPCRFAEQARRKHENER